MYGEISPEKRPRLELFKVPAAGSIPFLVRSESPLCFNAHFRERTLLCAGDDCPFCAEGLRRQWRGYVAVVRAPNKPGALELSAEAYDQWQEIKSQVGLAGRIITVSRRCQNAPAYPKASSEQVDTSWPLVPAAHLLDDLCRLLGIPPRSQYKSDESWQFAVSCSYRQQLDFRPIFRLKAESPPMARKNLA